MENEDKLSMLEHWVGTFTLDASLDLEQGDACSGDECRKTLIEKLEKLGESPFIEECVTFLQQTKWDNESDIELFRKKYDFLRI